MKAIGRLTYTSVIVACVVVGLIWLATHAESGELWAYLPVALWFLGFLLAGFLYAFGGTARRASLVIGFLLIILLIVGVFLLVLSAIAT